MIHQCKIDEDRQLRIETLGSGFKENEERFIEKCLVFINAILVLKNEEFVRCGREMIDICCSILGESLSWFLLDSDGEER